MRPGLQLARTRTRKGCSVSLEIYQAPVIIHVQPAEEGVSIPSVPLNFAVTLENDGPRHIGGVTVTRQVLLRRKIPRTKHNWTDWEEIQRQDVHVVGDCQVQGNQRFECSMTLPQQIPESRQTHYDQLIHLLTATVNDMSPTYQKHRHSPSKTPMKGTKSMNSASKNKPKALVDEDEYPIVCQKELESVNEKPADCVAICKKILDIVYCMAPRGDTPRLFCEQVMGLADSGKVKVSLHSDLFVIGSNLELSANFSGLTQDTTIHATSVKLIQETCTPARRELPDDLLVPTRPAAPSSPASSDAPTTRRRSGSRGAILSRLTGIFTELKDKPTEPQTAILDEYVMHSEGMDHYVTARGFGYRPGTYLWQGVAGRGRTEDEDYLEEYKLDHHSALEEHEATLRTTSSLLLKRSTRLPSSLYGVHPTSSTLAPTLARIRHRIAVNVIYSVLGQDAHGKPLTGSDTSKFEAGAPRQVTIVFELHLMPCTIVHSTIHPPSYDHGPRMRNPRRVSQSPVRAMRRLSMDTIRSAVSVKHDAVTPIDRLTTERLLSKPVHHSRAFRASNGLVVTGNRVFYSDQAIEEGVSKHHREKGSCACNMA